MKILTPLLILLLILFASCRKLRPEPPGYPFAGNIHEVNAVKLVNYQNYPYFWALFSSNFIITDSITFDSFLNISKLNPIVNVDFNTHVVAHFYFSSSKDVESKLSFFIDHDKKELNSKYEEQVVSKERGQYITQNQLVVLPKPPIGYKFVHRFKVFQF